MCGILLSPFLLRSKTSFVSSLRFFTFLLMASSFSHTKPSIFMHLPSQKPSATFLNPSTLSFIGKSPFPIDSLCRRSSWRPSIIYGTIRYDGTSSLNAPLEPTSFPGRSLGSVLKNNPESFYDAVSSELNRLSDDRDAVLARIDLSFGSPEACLHRRIAELKEEEYRSILEDIMYMIINKKFLEIRVPLVPNLEKCLYNGTLELLPSKVEELEAIHSLEELEMIQGYLTAVLGQQGGSSVIVSSTPTQIERLHLSQVYAASILYGYFLKSASLRHRLEHTMSGSYLDIIPPNRWAFLFGSGFYGIKSIALGEFSTPRSTTTSQVQNPQEKPPPKLNLYVQGLDHNALQECSKFRSKVAVDLAHKHCSALFLIENSFLLDSNKPILVSFASLRRLILESIAFGCFLWDAEEYIDRFFKFEQ